MVEIVDDVDVVASQNPGFDSGQEDNYQETSLQNELRSDTKPMKYPETTSSNRDEDIIPHNIQDYLAIHQIDSTVNRIVNKIIKERPEDPLSAIASNLLMQSRKSYPTFDKLTARRIFIADNPNSETLSISVFLNYQGRSCLRYKHNFAFDTEEQEKFLFDDPANKSGLLQGVQMICNEITETLRLNLGNDGLNVEAFSRIDASLLKFFETNLQPAEDVQPEPGARPVSSESIKSQKPKPCPGMAFIKACSEAIFFGVAHCIKQELSLAKSIRENLHPTNNSSETQSKLMINILSGGKAASSPVKFKNFYLIVDGSAANADSNIVASFKAFLAQLKTKFTVGKGGDTAFKTLPDASYFNAFSSIADSFKIFEESLNQANQKKDGRPDTNMQSKRAGTALSGSAAREANDATPDQTETRKSIFQVGVNCDADSLFNKDPKDPNKYEIEGVKTQSSREQLVEYYIKLCQDHPSLIYIEDPFSEADMDGYRRLKEALAEAGLGHVKIGMKHIFRDSSLMRVKDVTSVRPLTADEQKAEEQAKEEEVKRPPTQETGKKGSAAAQAAAAAAAKPDTGFKSPNHDKFVPDCVSIRTGALSTISDLFDFWRFQASVSDQNRFSLIIDDQTNEEVKSENDCTTIDLGMGLGCDYILLKGCARPEKVTKIQYYADYLKEIMD